MVTINLVTLILLIIGGLNWGLVGLFGVDLVAAIFGPFSILARVVYVLVGVSAIYQAFVGVGAESRRSARSDTVSTTTTR